MLSLIPSEHWDYSVRDMIRGLRRVMLSRRQRTQAYIHIPELGRCLPVRSARAAIVLALKELAIPPHASIGVPLYCCPVVFRAIQAAGCRARFIDVDPDTYCLSPVDLAAKSSEVDAVIAVHMFGNVCDMPALRKAAPGKPFIEDCAQALGSGLHGSPAGSFGEIAVFSFRSGKYLSVGEGGAVYCGQSELEPLILKSVSELPAPGRIDECVHVVTTYLRSLIRSKPLWGLIGSRLWSTYSEKVSYTSGSPIVLGQVYESDRDMTVRRLEVLASQINRQRWNAEYYSQNLAVQAGMICSETPGAFFNRLQYPLLTPTSGQCERLALRLLQNQITTARPYKNIAAIATTHYGYTGDCPQAERIAKTVLVIPCHHAIKAGDVERIAMHINRAWSELGGSLRGMGVQSIPCGAGTAPPAEGSERVVEEHHSS